MWFIKVIVECLIWSPFKIKILTDTVYNTYTQYQQNCTRGWGTEIYLSLFNNTP